MGPWARKVRHKAPAEPVAAAVSMGPGRLSIASEVAPAGRALVPRLRHSARVVAVSAHSVEPAVPVSTLPDQQGRQILVTVAAAGQVVVLAVPVAVQVNTSNFG